MNQDKLKQKKLLDDGFFYQDNSFLKDEINFFRKIIKKFYNKKKNFYLNLPLEDFRKIAIPVRNEIQKSNEFRVMQKKFLKKFKKIINSDDTFLSASYVTFFPTRPENQLVDTDEQLDFHRETFYSGKEKPFAKHQINIWLPIFNVKENQSIKYIPKSHKVRDEDIKTVHVNTKVKKGSASHTLGYAYMPKKIISGVDTNKAIRFKIPEDHMVVFDGNLIHGNGINNGDTIRFAIAFGVIKEKFYIDYSDVSFRSNLPYFIRLSD